MSGAAKDLSGLSDAELYRLGYRWKITCKITDLILLQTVAKTAEQRDMTIRTATEIGWESFAVAIKNSRTA